MEELRANVMRLFDVSEPDWTKQDPNVINDVRKLMEVDWEYPDNAFMLDKKFISHCRTLLKRESHKLHTYWKDVCKRDRSKPGPKHVDPLKWARLADHFDSRALLAKSAVMKARRAEVVNKDHFGRGGAVGAEKRLVRIFGLSISPAQTVF